MDRRIGKVSATHVEGDEPCPFVFIKPQNADPCDSKRYEFYLFLSEDRYSKLILNWRVGKRTASNALFFLADLKDRVKDRFQLTSDNWKAYRDYGGSVWKIFKGRVDYATETKIFGREHPDWGTRYSPMKVIEVDRKRQFGNPDLQKATTCHVERINLSVRLFTRRFTRCTMGFSKKLLNLKYAVALFVAHYNFCRVNRAHGKTPAMAVGLTGKPWTIEQLLKWADLLASTQ